MFWLTARLEMGLLAVIFGAMQRLFISPFATCSVRILP